MKEVKDWYKILSLSPEASERAYTSTEIKTAYHRALLRYHPDKAHQATTTHEQGPSPSREASTPEVPSIDDLSEAYAILRDPASRAAYNRQRRATQQHGAREEAKTLHVVDLDDMKYHASGMVGDPEFESEESWSLACRCGHPRGFVVTAPDLEAALAIKELLVGCEGCSLVIAVTFDDEDP